MRLGINPTSQKNGHVSSPLPGDLDYSMKEERKSQHINKYNYKEKKVKQKIQL